MLSLKSAGGPLTRSKENLMAGAPQKQDEPKTKTKTQRTLAELFADPLSIDVDRVLMHQAFQVPGAGTESTMSAKRTSGLSMRIHPSYGLIGLLKGKYFFSPSANVVVGFE